MNLHKVTAKDCVGKEYDAYKFTLSDGSTLLVDCALADYRWSYSSPSGFCQQEINFAEKEIRDRVRST